MANKERDTVHLTEPSRKALYEFMGWKENVEVDIKKQKAAEILFLAGLEAKRKERKK